MANNAFKGKIVAIKYNPKHFKSLCFGNNNKNKINRLFGDLGHNIT